MENEITLENITDEQQQKMCKLCELHIIEGNSNSQHFQCEGSYCDRAIEYLNDDIEESKNDKLVYVMKSKTIK